MPGYYLQRIEKTPGVRDAMPWQWFQGVYKDERDPNNFFARFGVDAKKLFLIQSEIRIPEEQKQAFIADRRGCVHRQKGFGKTRAEGGRPADDQGRHLPYGPGAEHPRNLRFHHGQ